MLFYEAVEHPKKDLLSSARRPSDTNPMSPVTSDGDKLSQLQVQDNINTMWYTCTCMIICSANKWIIKASLPTCNYVVHLIAV